MLCFFIISGSLNRIVCLVSIHQFKKIFIWNLVENCYKHLSLNLHLQVMDNFVTTSNHNCNKIISSKWLAGALSSALMGQCDRTTYGHSNIKLHSTCPGHLHTLFSLWAKNLGDILCVFNSQNKKNFVIVMMHWFNRSLCWSNKLDSCFGFKEAAWPSGHCVRPAIRQFQVQVLLCWLAGFVSWSPCIQILTHACK